MDIQKALDSARMPGKVVCPVCGDDLYSPMEKISISLYGKCSIHIENEHQMQSLLSMSETV